MHRALLAAVMILAPIALTTPAFAEIELQEIDCPFDEDAGFNIIGAKGEMDGVGVQYEWLAKERPGWGRVDQSTIDADGRVYDLLTISKGTQQQTICFDITDFFGKMD